MKALVEILALFCALEATAAFNSAAWLARRDSLSKEAARLRAAYSNCVARVKEAAADITVPIETFPDGSVKSAVTAKKAMMFLDTGVIWARGVTVFKKDVDGNVVAKIETAGDCVIDRKAKSGWAEGQVKLRHGETVFTGEGVYFSSPEGYVTIMRNSRIEAKDLKFGGGLQ